MLHSRSLEDVITKQHTISPDNLERFLPDGRTLQKAEQLLKGEGFEIKSTTPTHITIRGSPEQFFKVFGAYPEEHSKFLATPNQKVKQTYFRSSAKPSIPDKLADIIETIEFPEPADIFASPAAFPSLSYDYLRIPEDIARNMDATKVHARGITGAGIKIAMIDTGFMTPHHPYYKNKGYRIEAVSADPDDPRPFRDNDGHGTAIAACALAVAPGVTLMPVKFYDNDMAGAFHRAIKLNPDIITCSWGFPSFPESGSALKMAINYAIKRGIAVIFACGNRIPHGVVLWPASEQAVIAVGGVCIGDDDSLKASSFAVSGINPHNPGRQTPDLCGLCGMDPFGVYIVLPTQPGSLVDKAFSKDGCDRTKANDGWLVGSGTSSAAPMIAGVAALLIQANPALRGRPDQIREVLKDSCIDVKEGVNATGQRAGPGDDLATGKGLAQAYRMIYPVDIWIKHNQDSDFGLVPVHGRRPHYPPYNHWTSPDVKVFSSPLANPDHDFDAVPETQPVFGQDNYVYVRIRNRGRHASDQVSVRLHYADPSTNLPPEDWNDGQLDAGRGSISVGGVKTNLQQFPSVPALGTSVLPEPFVWRLPNSSSMTETQVLPNGSRLGHFCLFVTLHSAQDPLVSVNGLQKDALWDNNIGMKNVYAYSDPSFSSPKSIGFLVAGDPRKASKSDLVFDASKMPSDSTIVFEKESGALPAGLKLVNAKRRGGKISLKIDKKSPPRISGIMLDAGQKMQARISVRLPNHIKNGKYPLHLSHILDGKQIGGITFVARVANLH